MNLSGKVATDNTNHECNFTSSEESISQDSNFSMASVRAASHEELG